jgi:hypothetical protein
MVQAQLRKVYAMNLLMAIVTMTTTNILPKDPIVRGWAGTGIEALNFWPGDFWFLG